MTSSDVLLSIISALALTVFSLFAWHIQHGAELRDRANEARDTGRDQKVEVLDSKLDDLVTQVAILVADKGNNGGSTTRDAIDRIERQGDESAQQLGKIDERLGKVDDRLLGHLIAAEGDHVRLADHLHMPH